MLFFSVEQGNDDVSEEVTPSLAQGPAVTELGDTWILGGHKVTCGDARDPDAYARILNDQLASAVFTDPPYNVKIEGNVSGLGAHKHREFPMASGEMKELEFERFLSDSLVNAAKFSKPGAVNFVCMDWRHDYDLQAVGRKIYGTLLNICVWNKSNAGMGSLYRSKHELIFVYRVRGSNHINNIELGRHGRNRTNVWDYPGASSFSASRQSDLSMHPTVKPVAMVRDAILDVSKRGDVILDPFGGSGSTLMAAEGVGRRAALIELDPHYVDLIVRRWQSGTGEVAYLERTSTSFEEAGLRRAQGRRIRIRIQFRNAA